MQAVLLVMKIGGAELVSVHETLSLANSSLVAFVDACWPVTSEMQPFVNLSRRRGPRLLGSLPTTLPMAMRATVGSLLSATA